MNDEIIMIDSPEAAKPHTMDGWLSRNGFFYRDEQSARYDGCTHRPCNECGAPARKSGLLCDECREVAKQERYLDMPVAEWDGNAMLYSEALDKYFRGIDDAEGSLEEGQTLADLRLVICEPNYASTLGEDYFCEEMEENAELPGHIADAIAAFNEAVSGTVLSFSPGKYRLKLEGSRDDWASDGNRLVFANQ